MSKAIHNLKEAQKRAIESWPDKGGFPHLAYILKQAGITRNVWYLPSCQSFYYSAQECVAVQNKPLFIGEEEVPSFDQKALIFALQKDQAGLSTFSEFLQASWEAGVISYEIDFLKRTCTYYGINSEQYAETYPDISLSD